MSGTTMSSSCEWVQFYEQSAHEDPATYGSMGFVDSTLVAATCAASDTTMVSPTISSITASGSPPKKGTLASKPIRRRSRASRRTPVTLLNANKTNFRSLVQQFTGCPAKPTSLRNHKGPVNLNFQMGSVQSSNNSNSVMGTMTPTFGNNNNTDYYYFQQQQQEQLMMQQQAAVAGAIQQHQLQGVEQQQQRLISLDLSNDTNNFPLSSPTEQGITLSDNYSLEMEEGFCWEDNISWNGISQESLISSQYVDDDDDYF